MWLKSIVHEGMNHISNVEVHLKTRSGRILHSCSFQTSLWQVNRGSYMSAHVLLNLKLKKRDRKK